MLERLRIFVCIFERLAHRELELKSTVGIQIAALQLLAHRNEILGTEAEGLQVCHAPVRLAGARIKRDAFAVSSDGASEEACGFQRIAIAHPDSRTVRVFHEDLVVESDRLLVVADPAQDHCLEIPIPRMFRLDRQQRLDFGKRLLVLAGAIEHLHVGLSRGMKARCQFKAAREQLLRIVIATRFHREFGQHADRGHIGWGLFQTLVQQRFGLGYAVVLQCCRSLKQFGIVRRELDVTGIGGVDCLCIAHRSEMGAQHEPCLRKIGLQCDRVSKRCHCTLTVTGTTQRNSEFEVCHRPMRV